MNDYMELNRNDIVWDCLCPKCSQGLSVHWHTEYGDPYVGDSYGQCPWCAEIIVIETEVITNYSSRTR